MGEAYLCQCRRFTSVSANAATLTGLQHKLPFQEYRWLDRHQSLGCPPAVPQHCRDLVFGPERRFLLCCHVVGIHFLGRQGGKGDVVRDFNCKLLRVDGVPAYFVVSNLDVTFSLALILKNSRQEHACVIHHNLIVRTEDVGELLVRRWSVLQVLEGALAETNDLLAGGVTELFLTLIDDVDCVVGPQVAGVDRYMGRPNAWVEVVDGLERVR